MYMFVKMIPTSLNVAFIQGLGNVLCIKRRQSLQFNKKTMTRTKTRAKGRVDDNNSVFNVKSEAKLADWSKGGKWATDCPRFWPFMFYQRRKVKSLITTVKYEMTGHHMKAFFKVKTGAGLSLYFSNHT